MTIRKYFTVLVMIVLLMVCGTLMAQENASNHPEVDYNSSTDQLTINAEKVSLSGLYQRISILSGVDVWMDPEVEQTITVTVKDQSLEEGLKFIGRQFNLNQALIYAPKKPSTSTPEFMVVAAKVMPEGKQSNNNLKQLVGPIREGVMRSEARLAHGDSPVRDLAIERWQLRMAAMPEKKRKIYEARIERRLEDKKQQKALKTRKKEEQEKKKADRLARREERDEKIKAEDPERYERMIERREERRQNYLESLRARE